MNTSSDARNPIEALAEEFLDRKRRGEQPTFREYVERYPELADDIRDLFPALLMVEDLGESSGGNTGALAADTGAAVGNRLQRLGDYRILREIGRGGMGVVYEAEQESLGRRVALKVLSGTTLIDPRQVRRFEREARAAARLHHTNIVPVFGVGHEGWYHYFVMQFIAGLGLDVVLDDLRRLRQGKSGASPAPAPEVMASRVAGLTAADVARSLIAGRFAADAPVTVGSVTEPFDDTPPASASSPPADFSSALLPGTCALSLSDPDRQYYRSVARIGVQVAEALEYANRQGILHRDVKPSNLLLDNHGNVWVADFGLAKTGEADDLTHTGDILGTIRYMAPERFEGRCDARSDVYSLGLTLYELVALRPAYEAADRHALMERVLHEEPARLKKLAPGVPRDLETIIAKATARDPAARYATAAALAEDLQRFVEDRPIRARRAGLTERAWRWCKRNPWLASATGATAAALVAVAVIATVYAAEQAAAKRKIREALGRSNRLAADLETSLKVSEQRLKMLNYERARTSLERGRAACDRGDMGPGLLDLVESWRSAVAAGDPALAHAARASLSAWRHQSPRLLCQFPHTDKGSDLSMALSPDGKVVATGGTDNLVRLWDAATGQPIGPPLHQDALTALAFNPDGKTVLTVSEDGTVRLWDADTGQPIGRPLQHGHRVVAMAFSPDGRTALTASGNEARLWDVATGQPIGPPLRHQGPVRDVAFSPDGKTVLTGSDDQAARLWDAATGQPIGPPLKHQGPVRAVAFSGDGKTALTGASDAGRVWDAATGQPVAMPVQDQGAFVHMVFSADGKAVLTSIGDGAARLWDTTKAARPLGRHLAHRGLVRAVAYSPDGKTVLTGCGDGTARLWDAASGQPIGQPLGHGVPVFAVAFSPDGRTALTAGGNEARLWDVATGQPIGQPLGHGVRVFAVAFSPDGKTVLTGTMIGTALLWNAATGRPLASALRHNGVVSAVAFSRDGKTVLTGCGDGTARLWDADTGQPIGPPLKHQGPVRAVAYSPDVKTVLTGCEDGTARLWDAASGQLTGVSITQRERLYSAALSPDGGRILTGSADQTARFWDAATGQPLGPPLPHQGGVSAVAFSPDGRTALTAGGNEAWLWDVAELPEDLPRLGDWVHVSTGLALDERGQVTNLDGSAWREHCDRLAALGGAPEAEPRWRLDPILFGPEPTARAKAWAERKHWGEAEAAFNEAVAVWPLDPAVRLERAGFYASRSRPEEAAEDYARSYALGSRDAKLIDTIAGSEPLFRCAVAESPGSAAPLWAKHGALRVSQARWDEAAADFDRELDLLPEGRSTWFTPRSARALELARWERAYARLLELRPDDGHLWSVRGRYHARRSHWDQAAADFARGVRSAPPESEEWFEHACLRLIVGDHEGYRASVREHRRRAGRTEDPFLAFVLARTAGMTADETVVEPAQAIRWAEQAVASNLNGWYLQALGLAHYRAGQLDQAIRRLEESTAGNWAEEGKMQNRLIQAMAYHRLGHAAPARALLEEVERWWKDVEAGKTDGAVAFTTTDWLPLQILRREAEAVVLYDPIFPDDPFARRPTP